MTASRKILITAVFSLVVISTMRCTEPKDKKISAEKAVKSDSIKKYVFVDSFKVRALTDIHYESTPKRLEQGAYLANGLLQCFTCHSPRKWDLPGAPPIDSLKGSGGVVVNEDSVMRIIAPNITSDKETGGGTWTDDMFARAIREGVGHDGRALNWRMPHFVFRNLADEDLASLVVYLRTLPPVHNLVAQTKMYPEEKSGMEKALSPITEPVPTPVFSDSLKRGSYLVKLGECVGCHTSHAEYNPGLNGGANDIERFGLRAFSANITGDSSGIAYGEQAFIFTIRTGKGGTLSPIMPWIAYRNMNDQDLRAIYAYLKTLPPSRHFVSNTKPFTKCGICGLVHGRGSENKKIIPNGIDLDPSTLKDYVGTYTNKQYGSTYIIVKKGNKLYGKTWDKGPERPMIARTPLEFTVPGWVIPVRFIRDSTGGINSLTEETDMGAVHAKMK